jgi:hypothetical protein
VESAGANVSGYGFAFAVALWEIVSKRKRTLSMNDWGWVDRALGELAACGAVEVRENGQWVAGLSGMHYELRRSGKMLLVHLWSDERSLTPRAVKVKEQSSGRISVLGAASLAGWSFSAQIRQATPGA